MRLLLALVFISFNALAVEWYDLEANQDLKITQSFQLKQQIASGSLLDIVEGQKFTLKEIISLDMINVTLYKLDYKNCPGPAMATDMEIIPVKNTSPMVEVGAQLIQNCTLEIFIESKDLMTESFFE